MAEIFLVGCQAHTCITLVAVIQKILTKNVLHWFKTGALWNYHC